MTEFVIHGIPGSPYVRAPLLALEEKGLPWRLAAVPMGGNRMPDYRAIHPFRKIPTLDHGDFRLYETRAILNYLDRIAPEPALTPTDPCQAARMDQLIGITDAYLAHRVSGPLTFPRMVAASFGMPVDDDAVAAAIPAATEVVDEVARLLADQPFMAGDALSLADLMLAPHLVFLPHFAEGAAILAPHANLAAWIERMEARPSMKATTWDRLREGIAVQETVAA
ncbi:MAG: putative glutathione S-transferase [Sphingomonas bacterium]|uniref:glutathione S-transferase family protein n=1 Tax=Sphingomonas bacterium TaxID=1895847 RepID=UPI00260B25E9|nr:glutathione S-transferase family protein [Sphingomonas bacterium]MDB5707917.1 putative glutathione S-transferase [Sphingomonas bacterium]